MTYKLINKNTRTPMRGTIKSREVARQRKRSQKNPKNWLIAQFAPEPGSTVLQLKYVR